MTPNKNIEEQVEQRLRDDLLEYGRACYRDLGEEIESKLEDEIVSYVLFILDQQRQEHLSELRSIKKWTKGKNIPPTVKDELRHKLNLAISKIKGEE